MRIRSILAKQDSTSACLALAGILYCAMPCTDAQGEILHRYSFEGEGTVAIDSIGGNHGSIIGGTRLDGSGQVDLDGFDDYIELPPGIISKFKNTSFEVWTTWDGPTTSYWERIFDFGRDTRQYLYLSPRISVSPKKARFAITKTGSERKVNSSIALAGDKKTQYHMAVSYDDENNIVSLYIDGELQNSTITTISLADIQDDNNWLGRSQFTMIPYYDGRITEFRIHDRALTEDSVKSSFQKGPDDLPGPVINAFRVDKSIVRSGETVKLIWDVTAGETLEIDGLPPISGANGFLETTITTTTEFTLRVANSDGSRTAKTRVIVDDRPVIRSFSASNYQVNAGETITLTWDSRHADSVAIDEGTQAISGANGTVEVTINRDTVYTLTATNNAGRTTSSVRILLPRAANPVISEIKSNNTSLKDNDGEYSDWIEIHNPASTTIDLDGWFLTDNKDRRDKWRLPSHNLQPGTHLLVYCSGKDKSPVNNGELHTNFRLSTDGSYLALSKPDKTIVHEFDPGYPLQFEEYSYGLSIHEKAKHLIKPNEIYNVYIPTNSAPEGAWKGSSGLDEFDDSTWRSGPGGIGTLDFENEELLLDLKEDLQGKATSLFVRIPFHTDDEFFLLERLGLDLDYGDGFIAYLNGKEVARKNISEGATWNTPSTKSRAGSEILTTERFLIPNAGTILRKGRNILAIHLFNFGKNDPNFYLKATLTGYEAPGMDLDNPHFLYPPTPGTANSSPNGPPLTTVSFSQTSRSFKDPLKLELTHTQPEVVIRYTTNQSIPTTNSSLYTAPITLSNSTQVRARAFSTGFTPSPTQSHTYIRIASNAQGFSSNLPIVVVDNFGIGKPNGNTLKTSFFGLIEPDKFTGRAKIDDAYKISSRAGTKVRGSSSSGFAKYALALETWNEDDEDREIKPLGMPANSDWVLSGRYRFDLALVRNPFIYELSNQMGVYAPRTRFVEVFMDTDGGSLTYPSNYMGVYAIIEKIKRDEDRVNVARMDASDNATPDVTGGYILKVDRADPGDASFSAGGQGSINHVYPKTVNLTTAQRNYIRNYIGEYGTALDQGNYKNPSTGLHYREYFDVHKSIDNHLLRLLTKDPDGLRLSTYLYKPRSGKLTYGPIWDFDRTLGCDNDGRAREPTGWNPSSGMTYFTYAWWGKMFKDPDFRQDYVDRYQVLRKDIWSISNTNSIVDNLASQIREAQARNWQKWGDSTNGGTYSTVGGGWEGEVSHLKGWIKARVEWMDKQFLSPPTFSSVEGEVAKGSRIELSKTNNNATFYYTTDGTDPRLAGGGISTTAKSTTSLSINETTKIIARIHESGHQWPWSSASEVTFIVGAEPARSSNLAITEINYNPLAPTREELGRNPGLKASDFEFVELKNIGTRPINLNKTAFTEGIEVTLGNHVVDPGKHTLVVANIETFRMRYGNEIPISATFSGNLKDGGEKLRLVSQENLPIHYFEYQDDKDWPGRADGNGSSLEVIDTSANYHSPENWRSSHDYLGSPGRDGSEPPVGILINEALTHTDLPLTDTIELYNPTNSNVDISGWWLSDSNKEHAKFQIPSGNNLPAGGYKTFNETHFNPTPLNPQENHFSLNSAKGDDIYLLKGEPGKTRPIAFCDHVEFGAALNGISFGRVPDGEVTAPFVPQTDRTLGKTNSGPRFGPVVITEILYQPKLANIQDDPNDLEYIEIHNSGTDTLNLTGWRIRKGIDFDFPAHTILPAHGTLTILSFNPDKPENRDKTAAFALHYGVNVNSRFLGGYKGSLDNMGEVLHLQKTDNSPADEPAYIPHPITDAVRFNNKDPWPQAAGNGQSLNRTSTDAFGLIASSWTILPPSPGSHGNGDSDEDGLPDEWENQYFSNQDSGPDEDFDGDTQSNLVEYHAGTDPTDIQSAFTAITTEKTSANEFTIHWFSAPGKTYNIQYVEKLTEDWMDLRTDVPAATAGNATSFTDSGLQGKTQRYYRILLQTD
ncbi:MAG: hypothetical protein HOK49_07465 [Opitutae bacterium]|nr:hypothetical protein [Opitutae bacterium]